MSLREIGKEFTDPPIGNDLTVYGDNTVTAAGRLEYMFGLIERRRAWLNDRPLVDGVLARFTGTPFELHVYNIGPLLDDDECRAYLEHAIRHGGRCGVQVTIYGRVDEVSLQIARRSGRLLAEAIDAGPTLRVVEPSSGVERPPLADVPGGRGGELASAIMLRDAETAGSLLVGMILAASADAVALAYLARELRRAADAIAPGDASIPCPLCLASPRFRSDEIETHLIQKHSQLGEGMRP